MPQHVAGLVDVHTHFVTAEYAAAATEAGIPRPDGMPRWPEWTPQAHLGLMDELGIAKAVLSVSSPGVHFGDDARAVELARVVNDVAASLTARQPERFGFFASLPLPDVGAALAEARRGLERGAVGVLLLSHHAGVHLGDAAMDPVYELLDDAGAAVLLHPTSPPHGDELARDRPRPMLEFMGETGRAVVDLLFNEVFLRYPRIRFVLPHCGAAFSLLVDRIETFRSLLPGPSGGSAAPQTVREQLGRAWFDTAGNPFPDQVPTLVRVVEETRLLYGSDFCFTPDASVRRQVGSIDAAAPPASAATWRDLLAGNARAFLADSPGA